MIVKDDQQLSTGTAFRISRLKDLDDVGAAMSAVDAIFFEASNVQQFESDAARRLFRERWLGRYLSRYPDEVFIALAGPDDVIGYLVGCLDDPLGDPLFADIPYFGAFAPLLSNYPAHLHINVTAAWRSRGVGACLIETFADHATASGTPGMHVVTAEGVRNNRFYLACGFRQLVTAGWNGRRVAFFGRKLGDDHARADLPSPGPLS